MNLTNEEIKALIRKSQGWTELKEGAVHHGWKRGDEWHYLNNVPNYPKSLDACAEFEKTLTTEQRHDYVRALRRITEAWDAMPEFTTTFATARQRCLAYLKTKGILP